MENVSFTIDGVGVFEFRPHLSYIEETKLSMLVDEFLDYRLEFMRNKAFDFQNIVLNNLLKNHFNEREYDSLDSDEKKRIDVLYREDRSSEAIIARNHFWQISIVENAFRLNMLKVSVPNNIDFMNIDQSQDGLFFKILINFENLTQKLSEKKNP